MAWVDATALATASQPAKNEIEQVEDYVARKAKPRFYADENFPSRAVAILRGMGARVETAAEARMRRDPDENHAAYALRKGLILVTCDRDFLNNRRFPLIHCPAIFVFDFGRGTPSEIWQAYTCLGTAFVAPQFCDKWMKVDARRDCWTEHCRYLNGSTSRIRYRVHRGTVEEWVDR